MIINMIQHVMNIIEKLMNMPLKVMMNTPSTRCRRKDIRAECLYRLEGTTGPVLYKSGEVQKYDPDMGLVIPERSPCVIEIINETKNNFSRGLGCYYGSGHVLSALHVIKNAGEGEIKILIYFNVGDNMLVYKAEFTKYCNIDADRDQALIKLLGDISPLGDGLQDQTGEASETGSVYFYTLTPDENFQKQEGEICHPNLNLKTQPCIDPFLISVAGEPGDSGSPVYDSKDELIGIYVGCSHNPNAPKYGYCAKISPQFIP